MHYVANLEEYVGQKLTVKITEANKAKRNLIVSRRAKRNEPGAPSWMHTLGLVLSIIGLVLSVIFGILQLASLIAYFAALSSFSTY